MDGFSFIFGIYGITSKRQKSKWIRACRRWRLSLGAQIQIWSFLEKNPTSASESLQNRKEEARQLEKWHTDGRGRTNESAISINQNSRKFSAFEQNVVDEEAHLLRFWFLMPSHPLHLPISRTLDFGIVHLVHRDTVEPVERLKVIRTKESSNKAAVSSYFQNLLSNNIKKNLFTKWQKSPEEKKELLVDLHCCWWTGPDRSVETRLK